MVEKLTLKERRKYTKLASLYQKRFDKWVDTALEVLSYYPDACSMCGRCCKNTTSEFTEFELEKMIKRSGLKASEFAERYTYLYSDGVNRLKTPCPLLVDNKCSIYDIRPRACRIYPLNFPFSVYDVESCELSKAIRKDLDQISESEFRDGLDFLERDEDFMKKLDKISGVEEGNSRRVLNSVFQESAEETMPKVENGPIVQVESCSPVHFEVLLKKKRKLR